MAERGEAKGMEQVARHCGGAIGGSCYFLSFEHDVTKLTPSTQASPWMALVSGLPPFIHKRRVLVRNYNAVHHYYDV